MPSIETTYDGFLHAAEQALGLHHSGRPIDLDHLPDGTLDGAFSIELDTSIDDGAPARGRKRVGVVHTAYITVARRTRPDDHDKTYRQILRDEVALMKSTCGGAKAGTRSMAALYAGSEREYSTSREWIISRTAVELRGYVELT